MLRSMAIDEHNGVIFLESILLLHSNTHAIVAISMNRGLLGFSVTGVGVSICLAWIDMNNEVKNQ